MKDRRIKVEYPDGSGRETTENEQREFWKDERPEWVESFFKLMEVQGYAFTRFGGKYSFID
jgi:hypothetical protein